MRVEAWRKELHAAHGVEVDIIRLEQEQESACFYIEMTVLRALPHVSAQAYALCAGCAENTRSQFMLECIGSSLLRQARA